MRMRMIGVGIAIAAVIMIVVGVANGQHNSVFGKAIRVCLECIGIG